jgi:hypothetical protein
MTQIDRTSNVVGRLSAEQRKVIGDLVASAKTTIDQQFDKVLAQAMPAGMGRALASTGSLIRSDPSATRTGRGGSRH